MFLKVEALLLVLNLESNPGAWISGAEASVGVNGCASTAEERNKHG